MRMRSITLILMLCFSVIVLVSYVHAENASMPAKHPTEVVVPVLCSQCHTDWRGAMDHTQEYGGLRHKFYARQHKETCGICHKESFCSDCHAHREQNKPSDKYKDSPERTLPHRGDYLNQHKIDGKVNPTSCMKCHGRQNNERCRSCHR